MRWILAGLLCLAFGSEAEAYRYRSLGSKLVGDQTVSQPQPSVVPPSSPIQLPPEPPASQPADTTAAKPAQASPQTQPAAPTITPSQVESVQPAPAASDTVRTVIVNRPEPLRSEAINRFELSLISSGLVTQGQSLGNAGHEVKATAWPLPNLGLTVTGSITTGPGSSRPLGLDADQPSLSVGAAFRTNGSPRLNLNRFEFQFGRQNYSDQPSFPAWQAGLDFSVLGTRHEWRAAYLQESSVDLWIRTRSELAVIATPRAQFSVGAQYSNLSHRLVLAPGYYSTSPLNQRYHISTGGGYLALNGQLDRLEYRGLVGAGKGSNSRLNYLEAEARLTVRL